MDYAKDRSWVENLKIQSYSDHPEVREAADILVSEHYKDKTRKRNIKGFTRDARKLIASLWLHEQALFKFTTKKAYFEGGAQGQRKQVWMTSRTLKLFNAAKELGWIELERKAIPPQVSKTGQGFNSVYRTTETFYQLLSVLKQEDVLPDLEAPRIELKSSEDVLQDIPNDYQSSGDYSATYAALEQHYQILQQSNLKLSDGKPVPLPHLFFVRKFKHSMTQGGRLYALIQNYPKEERLGITINDYPVCSIDISQLHPQLILRFMHKKDAEERGLLALIKGEDAYTMPDYTELPRAIHKKLVNTLFNAKTEDSAARSLMNNYYQFDEDGELQIKSYKGRARRKGIKVFNGEKPKQQAHEYIASFRQHHPQLKEAICTDIGTRLQSIDGRMMLAVIELFNHMELPVIPVHDELIVPRTKVTMYAAELALKDAFNNCLGEEGCFGSIFAKWSFADGTKEQKVEIKLAD